MWYGSVLDMRFVSNEYYLGNIDLLDGYIVAFLASSSTPESEWTRVEAWIERACNNNWVIISGFQSAFERRVLERLLQRKRPIILYLPRSIHKRIIGQYRSYIEEGLMLIESYRPNIHRTGRYYSFGRNVDIISRSDILFTAGVTRESSIDMFVEMYRQDSCSCRLFYKL